MQFAKMSMVSSCVCEWLGSAVLEGPSCCPSVSEGRVVSGLNAFWEEHGQACDGGWQGVEPTGVFPVKME